MDWLRATQRLSWMVVHTAVLAAAVIIYTDAIQRTGTEHQAFLISAFTGSLVLYFTAVIAVERFVNSVGDMLTPIENESNMVED